MSYAKSVWPNPSMLTVIPRGVLRARRCTGNVYDNNEEEEEDDENDDDDDDDDD